MSLHHTMIIAVLAVTPVLAQSPQLAEDFTFKRVAPPAAGETRRITIQIGPAARPIDEQIEPPSMPLTQLPAGQIDPKISEFWAMITPEIDTKSPARLGLAADAARALDLPAPSLSNLENIARTYGRTIMAASVATEVSPALVLAVIWVESTGRATAISRAGAQGLMQLIPATAERFDVKDALDPVQNITGGAAYLSWLLNAFGGDPILALAGYNAGETAVKQAGGVPDYPETRAYVPKVIAAWRIAKSLCLTAPELPTDGCVFASLAAT